MEKEEDRTTDDNDEIVDEWNNGAEYLGFSLNNIIIMNIVLSEQVS